MPKNYQAPPSSEWSVFVDVSKLSAEPKTYRFEASPDERADLARRFGILSVEQAQASVTIQQLHGGVYHAIGTLNAAVTQNCVVSLTQVEDHIEESFEGWFNDSSSAVSFARAKNEREAKKANMEVEMMEESADPEPVIGGKIDIGELAAQNLALALNPYPHAPGVRYELGVDTLEEARGDEGGSVRRSPFEALKDWKEKR